MKAAFLETTGSPDVIQYGDLDAPQPGPSQLLIRVGATSVNPIDTYIRGGANYWEFPKPYIPGCDFAGEVVEVGEGVDSFKPGDRVWGSNQGLLGRQGTFAELICVDACWAYRSPQGVDDVDLAACALVGITAHLGLFQTARLQADEWVYVNGGSGGVGSMVVQMAKAAGARVVATAGSDEKRAYCRSLGADLVLDYRSPTLMDELQAVVPAGCQVYWETIREPDFDAILPKLSERGRIILMAGRDARPAFPVGPFYVKGCSLLGFVMFKATAEEQRVCADAINRWLVSGELKAHIGQRFALSEAAEAHRLQERNTLEKQGTLSGKIVLKP